jgi:hypothetical protein
MDVKLPLLILQVIEMFGKHMPIKALITYMAKCKRCHEMRDYNETQIDEDTEEVTVDQFNALMQRGVPVMKQIVPMPGEGGGEPEEEDEEQPSKIGFRPEND